jgi:RES domain-containing protein
MLLYRICKTRYAHDLSGTGAKLAGGRWNPKGLAVLYTSQSRALAALEFLVHLEFMTPPDEYSMLTLELPDELEVTRYSAADLPSEWQVSPAPQSTINIGSRWLTEGRTPVLAVPSTLISQEYNYLFNPLHEQFRQVKLQDISPFQYDERLLGNSGPGMRG